MKNYQAKLSRTDWDMVIVDEAHKMSASIWGGEIKVTKRYRLGELLGSITRHFLLMTATPHNGKEEDFQMFLKLIDADRFEGRFREGVHEVDVSDILRRMVKENLYRFDGRLYFLNVVPTPSVIYFLRRNKLYTIMSPTTYAPNSTVPKIY